MDPEDLLENERVEKMLSPHPFSFMRYQSLCLFWMIWSLLVFWLFNFSDYDILRQSDWYVITLVWIFGLLLVGVIFSLIAVQWSIFFLFLGAAAGGVGLMFWQGWQESAIVFVPVYSAAISIVGFLIVELYRRSHKYIISNLRIIFMGGITVKRKRTLRYDKITDIDAKQGVLGQIFSFGTIIPISQSGFGLGSDKSFAAGGVEIGGKRGGFLGLFGGGKEVQTPRARTYYELHGVYPYKEVHKLIENMVQGSVITPYQQEQVAFQKEQVDVQKEMRDLLKKQMGSKEEQEDDEKTDEE